MTHRIYEALVASVVLTSISFLLIASLAIPASAAEVWIVTCVSPQPPGTYPDINTALYPANPGDTIVVEECVGAAYPPFVVDGKSLIHIVAADQSGTNTGATEVGVGYSFQPSVVVDGLSSTTCAVVTNSEWISISGFAFEFCDPYGVQITNSSFISVIGNRIEGASTISIFDPEATSTRIVGNEIVSSGTYGTFFGGISTDSTVVADNLIGSNFWGIGIDSLVSNTHIVNNDVSVPAALGNFGIAALSMRPRVERNTVTGPLPYSLFGIIKCPDTIGAAVGNDTGRYPLAPNVTACTDVVNNT